MKTITKAKFKQTEIGMIPEDWEVKKLSDVCSLIYRYPSFYGMKKFFHGVPVIRGEHLLPNGSISEEWKEYWFVSKEYSEKFPKTILKEDDVIMSVRGSVGTFSKVGKKHVDAQISPNLIRISPDQKKLAKGFLFYCLKTHLAKSFIAGTSSSSAVPAIRATDIKKTLLPYPQISEQQSISKILADLDSKIQLNYQMNKTLEVIGDTIFRHWFVDFEFPNEEGKPYKSSGGKMVYNEEVKKDIPEEWQIRHFSEIIEVNPKRELQKRKIAKKVGMTDLKPWQSWIENWNLEEYKSGQKFKNGDTLFARITPSLEHGKTALVYILNDNEVGFGSTEFIVFSKKVISSELYIFHLSRSEEIRNIAINAMTGTSGRQRVPDDLFDHIYTILPPISLIDEFEKITSFLFNGISNNAKEIKILSQIRDLLLPKLMSGMIRVPAEAR